jgi:hypothetical protein
MKLMILLLVFVPLALKLARVRAVESLLERHRHGLRRMLCIVCLAIVVATVVMGFAVATRDEINHDQSTILSIAAAVRHGEAMYPAPGAPVEYGLLYGPATYLLYIPALALVSTRLTPALLLAATASGLAMLAVLLLLWRRFGWMFALAGTALLVAFVAPFLPQEWEARGDPWILLAIALGLPAARVRNRWLAGMSIAVLGALLTNLKFPLLLVGLLPCVELWKRSRGRIPAMAAAALMPVLALAPFALPEISLRAYADQLREASHHGLSPHLISQNLLFTFYLVLPTICLLWWMKRHFPVAFSAWIGERSMYLLLMAAALGMAEITGAKYGAGPWHLAILCVPLAAIDTELFVRIWQSGRRESTSLVRLIAVPAAFALVLAGNIAIGWERGWLMRAHGMKDASPTPMPAVEQDLVAVLRSHPGRQWVMGYTDNLHYNFTSPRPLLQIYGMPLVLDSVSRNEADMARRPVGQPLLDALASCRYPDWILPREGTPFSMRSGYFLDGSIPTPELYPATFQQDFVQHYRPVESSRFFTLWHCAAS